MAVLTLENNVIDEFGGVLEEWEDGFWAWNGRGEDLNLFVRDIFFNRDSRKRWANYPEIYEQPVEDLWNLAVMIDISEETLESILDEFQYNSEFEDNVIYRILDFIMPKLDEMGFDGDATYDNVYWFEKRYDAKKDDDEYFKNFNRDEFKVRDPLKE